jgi:hypothetical protein
VAPINPLKNSKHIPRTLDIDEGIKEAYFGNLMSVVEIRSEILIADILLF